MKVKAPANANALPAKRAARPRTKPAEVRLDELMAAAEQLFLAQCWGGELRPQAWAESVWQTLSAAGERLVGPDGKPLTTPQDNLKVLLEKAQVFATQRLPVLRAAGLLALPPRCPPPLPCCTPPRLPAIPR